MKRLIIDDIRDLPLDGTVVRTVQEALPLLDQEWDEIYLDYDMGGKPYETDDSLTIMPVVDRLVEIALKRWEDSGFDLDYYETPRLPTIYIHTQNPVGRKRITLALERYYQIEQVMMFTFAPDQML